MKKLLFILVSVMVCCLVFAACGNKSGGGNSATDSVVESSSAEASSPSEKQLVGCEFNSETAKKYYFVGDELNISAVRVTATYDDGSTYGFNSSSITVDEALTTFNSSATGVYTVAVEAFGYKHSYEVRVVEKPVASGEEIVFAVDAGYKGEIGALNAGAYTYTNFTDFTNVLSLAGIADGVVKTVNIAPGTYDDKIRVSAKNVHFIGTDAATTVITHGDGSSKLGTDGSSTVTVSGEGFIARNVTFENSYDYNTLTQEPAVAALIDADKCAFYSCVFLGYQDTLQAKNGRQYYKNCRIEGTTDFIFGKNSTALFDECTIKTRNSVNSNKGYLTAHSGINKGGDAPKFGYVFMGCDIVAEEGVGVGTVSLGRPWRSEATVAYINCNLGAHISKGVYGTSGVKPRYDAMSGGGQLNHPEDAHFFEYGNTGEGAMTADEMGDRVDFTLLENADEYTPANIFATVNGQVTYTGEWNPIE